MLVGPLVPGSLVDYACAPGRSIFESCGGNSSSCLVEALNTQWQQEQPRKDLVIVLQEILETKEGLKKGPLDWSIIFLVQKQREARREQEKILLPPSEENSCILLSMVSPTKL